MEAAEFHIGMCVVVYYLIGLEYRKKKKIEKKISLSIVICFKWRSKGKLIISQVMNFLCLLNRNDNHRFDYIKKKFFFLFFMCIL